MLRISRILLASTVLFLMGLSCARTFIAWKNDAALNSVTAAFLTLADDFRHGELYRPLYGPLGYGGTRYFPLQFVLHAELWNWMGDFRRSGHLLNLLETLSLLTGIFALLRRLGCDRLISFSCAGLTLSCEGVQHCLQNFHADILPAALNVWALYLCAASGLAPPALLLAALLFALAFSAKATSIAGILAAFLYLRYSGRRRQAWILAGATLTLCLSLLSWMYLASEGRWWTVFRESATAGSSGARFLFLAAAPFYLFWNALHRDPSTLVFLFLGLLALLTWPRREWGRLPPLMFLCSALVAALVLTSPGTAMNQLIEPHAASLVILAAAVSREESQRAARTLALAVAALVALPSHVFNFTEGDRIPRRELTEKAIAVIGPGSKPILAENPLLPISAGERPYILDAWMLRVESARHPEHAEPLFRAIRSQSFRAVVLTRYPRTAEEARWYSRWFFGPEFLEEVGRNYKLVSSDNEQFIFLPRER